MAIVLIQWKIKPGHEDEFRKHWEQKLCIGDRTGLVGEFLCEPGSEDYITLHLSGPEDRSCAVFVNVGIWANADAFHQQIGKYFNEDKQPESFEAARRVRTVLYPRSRRMGSAPLPEGDTEGVG